MSARLQPSFVNATSATRWLQPMQHWPRAALTALQTELSVVRVLVASRRGSAPREAGASMLVSRDGFRGSIGGGHLEWQAIAAARELLPLTAAPARLQRFVLGRELAQCCGGVVELWIERYAAVDRELLRRLADASGASMLVAELESLRLLRNVVPSPACGRGCRVATGEGFPDEAYAEYERSPSPGPSDHPLPHAGEGQIVRLVRSGDVVTLTESIEDTRAPVWLYGAGHVGQAIAKLLLDLPLRLTWIDTRDDAFPSDLPEDIDHRVVADPAATVTSAPAGTRFMVLTHDHAQDYALCRAILARDDFAFAGVIGSASKAARFRSRLAREDGFDAARIARLTCPIGVDGIASKWPAAIAVSVAAQLLQTLPATAEKSTEPLPAAPACAAEGCASCKPTIR